MELQAVKLSCTCCPATAYGVTKYGVYIMGGRLLAAKLDTWDAVQFNTNAYAYEGANPGYMNGKIINPVGSASNAINYTSGLQKMIGGHAMPDGFTPALATDTLAGSGFTSAVY